MKNEQRVAPNDVGEDAVLDRSPRLDADDHAAASAVRDLRGDDAGLVTHRMHNSLYAECGATPRRDEQTTGDPTCAACYAIVHADDHLTGEEKFGGPEIFQPARVFRVPVASSNIKSIGYVDGRLDIEFRHGGVYTYANVPQEVYEALADAPSIGKHYAQYIRGQYPSAKVEESNGKDATR